MKIWRRVLTAVIVMSLVSGMLTGCNKKPKTEPIDDVVATATPVPDRTDTPTAEPKPTEAPVATDVPAVTEAPAVTDAPVESPVDGGTDSETGADGAGAVPEREYGGLIPEEPVSEDNSLWVYTVREFNAFLSGESKVSCMDELSDVFAERSSYNILEIGEGFRMELNSQFMDQIWRLDAIDYALIDGGYDGIPELAVTFTYNNAYTYDSPYQETMFIACDYGFLYFIGSITSYYREYSTVNEAGYCTMSGSSGANLSNCAYYFVSPYGDFRFMHSEFDIFGISEPKIPGSYLPSDTTVTSSSNDYTDHGGFAEIVSLKENVGDDYDAYLRNCYYTFLDFDGNPVTADEEYVKECAADGLKVVSGEEMDRILSEKELEVGLTEEVKNAPPVENWTPVPREAWNLGKGVLANLNVMADNMDMWLDSEGENYSCYAVTDMDFNGRFELIRAVMDFWTGDIFLSFYEVSNDFTELIHLDYEEQFTVDGEVDGHQPNIVNAEEIREYSGNGGNYYYVIPTEFYYDTLAYSRAVNRNMVIRKTNGSNSVVYEGYSGGVDWVTEYDSDDFSKITSEGAEYYRWDDTECTKEEYESINKAYFDFDPDGYNIFYINFMPMMKGSEDDRNTCINELNESFKGWYGGYVYSPDGK